MASSTNISEEISTNSTDVETMHQLSSHPMKEMEEAVTNPAHAIDAIEQSSSVPLNKMEETVPNAIQSIDATEQSPNRTDGEEKTTAGKENHNQISIGLNESFTHSLDKTSNSSLLESNLPTWNLDTSFDKQIYESRTTKDIFEILDDPELNFSTEEVRDDVSKVLIDKTFDLDKALGTNLKAPNDEDSFTSITNSKDGDFDINEALRNQNSTLNSSDYVLASDISIELDTTGNDSTTNNDSISKIMPSQAGSIDNSKLVAKPRSGNKRDDFCFYCKKMQTVISRHLEIVHKDVDEVKRFAILPKNNPERTQLIDLLRKKGNHLYNTSSNYNKDGKLLVGRRPKQERPGTQYTPCHNCHVSLSKKSIRRHRQKCVGASTKDDRANTILSRRTDGRIHANASKQLQRIFAVFNDDLVVQLIRYDELLIEFGNGMAEKYKKDQQQAMIRNRLRTLGRLLEEMKKCRLNAEPKITDFASIYDPGLYDCMLRAVNTLARFNEETGEHKVPSIVTSLGTYIKAVAEVALLVVRKKKIEKNNYYSKITSLSMTNNIALKLIELHTNPKLRKNVNRRKYYQVLMK
ncbi:uncharacterized protein [Venturia canescens]|uniref:uncharacterized protein n=1 Tax=Venturia canescens TaxID=32260 RepID=UPI001C9BCD85|nr:uncharacterized protein LOC122417435 [Venturia canescens]